MRTQQTNTAPERLLILTLLVLLSRGAWGQTDDDRKYMDLYQTTYSFWSGGPSDRTITTDSISHKKAKWYGFREGGETYNDTFDGENSTTLTLDGRVTLQATHTYVDTIYVHKGSRTVLELPYHQLSGATLTVSTNHYQRWFDYRTDGNYRCDYTPEGNTEGTIHDLLTPDNDWYADIASGATDDSHFAYRFTNGYVQIGKSTVSPDNLWQLGFYYPTDEEFDAIQEAQKENDNRTFLQPDNDYYVVACDVSNYNDTGEGYLYNGYAFGVDYDGSTSLNTATGTWYEPTLGGRAIYYIVGVYEEENGSMPEGFKEYDKLTEADYQGDGDSYLEEYEIFFPARRLSNHTEELVALSKDANAYAIPGISADDDTDELTVAFAEGENSAFELESVTLTGLSRVIQFYKKGATDRFAPWKVDDGTEATILVTKTVGSTTYHIARFKLTFKDNATPLTQTQVAGLGTYSNGEDYWWKDMTYRSPDLISENYDLLTSLTFTYGEGKDAKTVYTEGDEDYYPFPLDWNSSGYAFYDGCHIKGSGYGDWEGISAVQFCEYGIVKDYVGWGEANGNNYRPPKNTAKDDEEGDYWLYIDASDRPGTVAELSFEEKLCVGSEIIGTAWIKSAGEETNSDDAAVMLTIMGVTCEYDGSGNVIGETHTPLYRQCSGQIRTTTYLNATEGAYDDGEEDLDSNITGKGSGTNQWFQLYIRFVSRSEVQYDRYTLKVDNYCASTAGGDYYFDEVKLYILRPEVEMVQLDPICATSEDDKSAMRMDIEFESIMARLGFDPEDYSNETEKTTATTASVDFVIINETQYRNALAAYEGTTDPTDPDYDADVYKEYQEEAFKAALVTFYDASSAEHQFPTLDFYCNYGLNQEYDEEYPGTNIVTFDSNDEGYFYSRTVSPTEYLSVDCLTDMMAYTEYMTLLEPHTQTDKSSDQKLEEFIELMDDPCAIKTEFYLSSETILKLNGETLDPTADYCAGQEFVISPEVTYTDSTTGETIYLDGVYFDWFFGSRDEYVAENDTYGGVSLQEALIMFRTYYPDAEELSETETPPVGEEGTDGAFTQNHYGIIAYYLEQESTGGMNNMLVLHRSHLDMRVLNTGLELVIQPIEMTFVEESVRICFGYVPLSLSASGDAPTLKAGFSNINYPDDDYEPCLRLGLAQFEQCSEDTPFTINLHGATYITEADENGVPIEIDHLGVAEGMDMLSLVDTDDPAYRDIILGKGDEEEILIGKVTRLYATTENGNDPRQDTPTSAQGIGSYMQIYFYGEEELENDPSITPFTVREGYYYVVSVYFQEKGSFDGGEQAVGSACWGTFPLEMKIVPEYLVWKGDRTANWNNDSHWRRADRDEIHKASDDSYPSNAENGTDNGFVPMLFTKVIMPRDSEAELYMAGFIEGTDNMLSWQGDDSTANHEDVDEAPEPSNIMYDLMLYDTEDEQGNLVSMKTEHYRVNLCDQIHFEPGAQLLHSEQLIYNKAWTDVELAQGPWTLAATPLNGVVSGDWYTKAATGTETAEYFTDITFSNTDNDRLDPMVYQRNWSNSGNTIVYTTEADNSKTVPAYISTGWSSVYNDVTIPHHAGEGFSIKASRTISSTTGEADNKDNLMFRFPKADGTYTYQNGGTTETATISRENAGRLLISGFVDRTDPDKDDDDVYKEEGANENRTITVGLTQTDNGYYIVGNPFTAAMSMSAFMEGNEDIKGYWLESAYGPVAGTKYGTSWGTDDVSVEPYSAFFVTTNDDDLGSLDDSPLSVTFTRDMQEFVWDVEDPDDEGGDEQNPVRRRTAFAIRATGESGTTSASIAYADNATDDYKAGEDALLMEDASWKRDGMPLVYTVAGDRAVSLNSLKELALIPIGVFADGGSVYTLSFAGVNKFENPVLVDTYEDTETPITEGFNLEMEGPSHGRYYIRTQGMATDVDGIEESAGAVSAVSVYSPVQGTVVVSSDAGLESVDIYSVGGMLLRRASAGGSLSCTIDGVTSGIAIVRVMTAEGTTVRKIRVR